MGATDFPRPAAQVLTFTRRALRSHRYWTHVRRVRLPALTPAARSRQADVPCRAFPGTSKGSVATEGDNVPDKETMDRFGDAVEEKKQQSKEASEQTRSLAG